MFEVRYLPNGRPYPRTGGPGFRARLKTLKEGQERRAERDQPQDGSTDKKEANREKP